jgi:hypothetical protein
MQLLAKSTDGRHCLIGTMNGDGFIYDSISGNKSAEKSIVALLSANIEWEEMDGGSWVEPSKKQGSGSKKP